MKRHVKQQKNGVIPGFFGRIETAPTSACNTRRGLTRSLVLARKGLPTMVPKTCTIPECERPATSQQKTLCEMHRSRIRRHGDPHKVHAYMDPAEGFAARTSREGDCLVWSGYLDDDGYGVLYSSPGVKQGAHRYAWEKANGPIPAGLMVDHMCFNHACVEPKHLRLATNKQNLENREGAQARSKTGARGVFINPKGRYYGRVRHNGVQHHVGTFDTIAEAEAAVIAKRNELYTHNLLDRTAA